MASLKHKSQGVGCHASRHINVATLVRFAYGFRAMDRNWKWQVTVWAALGAYLALALLPAGAIVCCISEPGHSAIEFVHDDSPQATFAGSSVGKITAFIKTSPGCTDIKLTFSAGNLRKKSNLFLALTPKTFEANLSPSVTYGSGHYFSGNLSGMIPQEYRPTHFLDMVVLQI